MNIKNKHLKYSRKCNLRFFRIAALELLQKSHDLKLSAFLNKYCCILSGEFPNNILYQKMYCSMLMESKKYFECISFANNILANLKDYDVYYFRACSFFYLKEWKNAIDDFLKIVNFNKQMISPYKYLVQSFFELKDYQNAIFYSKQALSIKSDFLLMYEFLGTFYYDNQKFKIAKFYLEKAIDLKTKKVLIYENMAILDIAILNNTKHSISIIQKALNNNLESPLLNYLIGGSFFTEKEYNNAIYYLEIAKKQGISTPELYNTLIASYFNLGKTKLAQNLLKKAKIKYPDSKLFI